jgi:hypothetical protein
LTRAHEVDSATRWGRHLAAVADSIFAQFGSGPRRSLRRSAERPARAAWAALRLLAAVADSIFAQFGSGPRRSLRRSARPAGAAWAALRLLADVAIGATMELGRSWRTLLMMMLLLRPRGAGEVRGHRQQAALNDQRFRTADDDVGGRRRSEVRGRRLIAGLLRAAAGGSTPCSLSRLGPMMRPSSALRDKVHDRGSRKFGRESTA